MKGIHHPTKGVGITFDDVFLVHGARTGYGKLAGTIARVSPTDLGIFAAKAALERSGFAPSEIDQVIFSNLTQASSDAYYLPRHVGLYSGVPVNAPALLVQRLCGTGFEVIVSAAEQITLGKADRVLSGAAENMSLSPTVSYGNRMGYPLGGVVFLDFLSESLKDSATGGHMGCTSERIVREYGLTREDLDAFSALSQSRAIASEAERLEAEHLLSRKVRLPRRVESFMADEHIRPGTTAESLAKLRPAFESDGVQTAGNSSGIVDGAGAVVVASRSAVESNGSTPLARVAAATAVGVDPRVMGIGPIPAIQHLLEITGLSIDDIGLFEINEAFAGQCVACERALGIDREKLNIYGGAIALGHPLSATGTRLTLSLAMQMQRNNVKYGIASACVGGGQGVALLLENPNL
ncbi:UNVERIFIED_CONTAM: hypothetical protein GTU68_010767 [Idotea baltica]|nr:hypothetical protein [Idotea baltica]